MSQTYDAIIVGAGAAGASTAYHLIKADPTSKILLLDKFAGPCMGNSSKSAAKIRDTVTSKVNLALCRTSIEAYKEMSSEGHDLGLRLMGYLWLMSQKQVAENYGAIQNMKKNGTQLKMLDSAYLRKHLPQLNQSIDQKTKEDFGLEDAERGLLGLNCGSIDPELLVRHYESMFRAAGGLVEYSCAVEKPFFTPKGSSIESPLLFNGERVYGIKTDKGKFLSPKIIFATGAYSPKVLDENAGIESHVKPRKRQLYEFSTGEFDNSNGFKDGHGLPFTIFPSKGMYIYWQHKGRAVIGCADKIGRAIKFEENPAGEKDYFQLVVVPLMSEYFPFLKRGGLKGDEAVTAGMYGYSMDGVPNVDELVEGLFIVNGQSGRGIMETDALGRIAAAKVLGKERAKLHGGLEFKVDRLSTDPNIRDVDKEKFTL